MRIIHVVLLFTFISLFACSPPKEAPLKIIANSWIGYSPLFYAKEKGWLDPLNIQVLTVISLGESLNIYESAELDAFTGTQYEFNQVQKKDSSIMPIIMFDRSNGGDSIMANQSIHDLQETTQTIDVYLEIHSVNQLVFKDFIKTHNLTHKKFNYKNKNQFKIYSILQETIPTSIPTIIVTYSPYTQKLISLGLQELASTRNGLDILVIDALFTPKQTFIQNQTKFKHLKKLIDQAIVDLETDPLHYYEMVKMHLEDVSYHDFLNSLEGIEWLNTPPLPVELQQRLNQAQFPIQDLI